MPPNARIRRKLIVLTLLTLALSLAAQNASWVERYYSTGFYPPLAQALRNLLGWVPFSIGDVLYVAAGVYLLVVLVKAIRFLRKRRQNRRALLVAALMRTVNTLLIIYLIFQVLWGLNYSRQGIAAQMELEVSPYTNTDLDSLADVLQNRLLRLAPLVDTAARERLNNMTALQSEGRAAYRRASAQYPFLAYRAPSVKGSLLSSLGHLVGFTGYYNPFTAEAQVKTSIPVFLKPFVVTHEMAHQLGYAKENEANFVAFLTGRASLNHEVRYAVYFELFLYTLADMRRTDSVAAKQLRLAAPLRVQRDVQALLDYLDRSRNPIEPYMARIYDAYLRWNNQPKGRRSYNEVLAYVVAYGKKYGMEAI